jgi:hypothetical protein
MREIRSSGSEGGGTKPIVSPYPYHRAWGGAKRNPRLATIMKFKRAKRAIAQTPQVTVMNRLSPTSRAATFERKDPGVPLAKPSYR